MRTPLAAEAVPRKPLLVVVGPTASGKTALAVELAEEICGEIVSADSRQVYRGMDVGTAKATPEERRRAPHHLLDIVDPDRTLSLAQYQAKAYAAVEDILARSKVPILVGGTGQYVMAVVEGWQIPSVAPSDALRTELYQEAAAHGYEGLHARLKALDPAAAERIDSRNVRRVVRALEVCITTGRPISEQQFKSLPAYGTLMIGLTTSRAALYARIDARVDRMIDAGLEAEVRQLVEAGYGFDLPAMSGVGYGQFEPYLCGEAQLADVVREIKRATRRFVRQQGSWFRAGDPRIHWFDATHDPAYAVLSLVRGFLALGCQASVDPPAQASGSPDGSDQPGATPERDSQR